MPPVEDTRHMSIEVAHQLLAWPSREQILAPNGSGSKVFAQLAKEKLGQAIGRRPDGAGVNVGVLTAEPDADTTQVPIAIVCEFQNKVSADTLKETHALAWNFCRSPLLITIEPHLLRAWTCYEPPSAPAPGTFDYEEGAAAEIEEARVEWGDVPSLSQQAANSLHWVQLISGQFFRDHADRFRREQRADQMLLANLKYIRERLHALRLSYDVIHDLLARVIFIQFLFQRKDSQGEPALNDEMLNKLHADGELSALYRDLGGILSNYDDTYRLFKWLNNKFNGDLFPGEGATKAEREAEWQAEMRQVKPKHLQLLSEFVGGSIQMESGQWTLWQQYRFDAIPLEFISSIYEVFVNKANTGMHYTRAHVVDFMLDGVLPWSGTEWNLKILDPACGSGIFLVKAFQRLVQRWKNANPDKKEPPPWLLQSLLENNLFGVDVDEHAVRVASFSLYLAMCDEIDPRALWQDLQFPRLRERQVVRADFFEEDEPLFKRHRDVTEYDLIVGNAPWGHDSLSKSRPARRWAKTEGWETAYKDIGPLFLSKAASIAKPGGCIVMIQPAGGIISNQVTTAKKFRRKLFKKYKVEEVVNLSTLRFILFPTAISPACIVTMRPSPPDGEPFTYICPKPSHTAEDDTRIFIEPHDINTIYPDEAADDPWIWLALMWGGRRDLVFVRQLGKKQTLSKLKDQKIAVTRQGTIRGDRSKRQEEIVDRRIITTRAIPDGAFLRISPRNLPVNIDPYTHSRDSTDLSAFEPPQLIIRQSWQQSAGRFQALLNSSRREGIICSKSFISVHVEREHLPTLEAACLSYNSKLAVYYLLLSSGRFASYRPEANVQDLLDVPLPEPREGLLEGVETFDDVDRRTYEAFSLKNSERVLIEDLFNYTLPDFKGDISSPGRQRTRRFGRPGRKGRSEPELTDYCDRLLSGLKAGFGEGNNFCATIFQDSPDSRLPVRLVAIHLDWPNREKIVVEPMDSLDLWKSLQELNEKFFEKKNGGGGILYQRIARVFNYVRRGRRSVPTIYLIKPDQIRYWLRSTALRDADEMAADLIRWRAGKENTPVLTTEEPRVA
jgi:N-6 DNA Methylase